MDWQPSATLRALQMRAAVLGRIRSFFADRDVLEVETPALSAAAVTDLQLESFQIQVGDAGCAMYLQTSPEFAMKRLLAAGCGAIYQICKAFRVGEVGRLHNPEFTLLEWYRPGFDHLALMNEVEELLDAILGCGQGHRFTYREIFERLVEIDPFTIALGALREHCGVLGLIGADSLDREACLDFLVDRQVLPKLGQGLVFIHDFPASQAALARIRTGGLTDPPVAERFEAFVGGIELGNGYHELADPAEQGERFERDRVERQRRGLPAMPGDPRLLAALGAGLPDCAGVAIGVDRLIMLAADLDTIEAIMSFSYPRA